jgi:hypothetical protein
VITLTQICRYTPSPSELCDECNPLCPTGPLWSPAGTVSPRPPRPPRHAVYEKDQNGLGKRVAGKCASPPPPPNHAVYVTKRGGGGSSQSGRKKDGNILYGIGEIRFMLTLNCSSDSWSYGTFLRYRKMLYH